MMLANWGAATQIILLFDNRLMTIPYQCIIETKTHNYQMKYHNSFKNYSNENEIMLPPMECRIVSKTEKTQLIT